MTYFRVVTVLAASLLMLSCASNSPQEEARQGKDSRDRDSLFSTNKQPTSRAGLAVPPDLLASSNDKVKENQASTASGGGVAGYDVLPEIIGATIQSEQGRSWLKIDADAEVVWRKLTEFWAFQEIDLVAYQPESGLMETDWFVKTKPAGVGVSTIAADLLNAFTARRTALDKFTLRLERDGASGTKLFITHRGREKIVKEYQSQSKISEFAWVERAQDPEKVAQLLQTIVLLFDSNAEEPA